VSDRQTSIAPRDRNVRVGGCAAWGRKTRAEMIAEYRRYYRSQAIEAQSALALTDEDLIVETYLGPYAQRNREEVTT
jgi:hypothetical protein